MFSGGAPADETFLPLDVFMLISESEWTISIASVAESKCTPIRKARSLPQRIFAGRPTAPCGSGYSPANGALAIT